MILDETWEACCEFYKGLTEFQRLDMMNELMEFHIPGPLMAGIGKLDLDEQSQVEDVICAVFFKAVLESSRQAKTKEELEAQLEEERRELAEAEEALKAEAARPQRKPKAKRKAAAV